MTPSELRLLYADESSLNRMTSSAPRFWDKVANKVVKTGDCWIWTGARTKAYGQVRWDGRPQLAHRVAFLLAGGVIPDSHELDHLCRTPLCVRPDHLEAVPHRTNVLRGIGPFARKAAQTQCVNGHAFDETNTFRRRDGTRSCRRCHADQEAARRKAALA